jgi:hypothetical protein
MRVMSTGRKYHGYYLAVTWMAHREATGPRMSTVTLHAFPSLVLLRSLSIVHQHQDAPLYEHVSRY